ncbi:MAG: type II toxin-antitoxin system RelE/ParE family toxin [Reichenbachiella sp.]|uniref:type II toxin-antitoxin system RelE/ParE family toxin n=1 Tax=Reichenbachiella sp. TaxID=2184521 RepID=UPI002966FAF0|nr:type II toxin-antitoxin system RelE/ParE family toxin [Reichenbachiella sp.]MDW3210077.1 type II toxin-antitoxin system RelE/ParE family toxin [Reichenbachiella sp.]
MIVIERLVDFPQLGRKVPEFNSEQLRELILGKYRIVYRIYDEELIVVVRIVHGAKLID